MSVSKKDVAAGEVLPAHSKIGASGMHRWAPCPGSVRLSANMPNVSSAYAEEGTEAHDLGAFRLIEGCYDRHPSANNDEMLEAVEVYVNFVEGLRVAAPMSELLVEHRFDLSEIYPGLFGTADAIVYDVVRQILHVVDYKHGAGIPVEVEENEQLMYYGVGALTSLLKAGKKVSKVVLHIVQPRCGHKKGPVRSWETTPEALLDFTMELVDYAHATTLENAPLVPGDHCRFCPAKGVCPKLEDLANETAKGIFSEISGVPKGASLPNVSQAVETPVTPIDPSAIDPERLGKLLHWLPVLESWIKGVREFAYGEAEHGRPVPGWKLVSTNGKRKWTNEAEALQFLEQNFSQETVRMCMEPVALKSPAGVEKVINKKQHDKLKPLISFPKAGVSLVRESDPRPAVAVAAVEAVFQKIESSSEEIDIFS